MTQPSRLAEPLMSPQELADYLQVPLSTLAYWRRKGTGPRAVRVGRRLRYDQDDVQAWKDGDRDSTR